MADPKDGAIVLLGTSRSCGNTRAVVDQLFAHRSVEIIDLSCLDIGKYDYAHGNSHDDFLPTIERAMAKKLLVVATPVYWYAMSAPLKIFFDRLSDLVTIRKDLGRSLQGKSLAVVASGTDTVLPEGFEVPFSRTCTYLNMKYLGACYVCFEGDNQPAPLDLERARAISATWVA